MTEALKQAIEHVTTPFVFVQQHDLVLKKVFDLNGLLATMVANPGIKHVRPYGCRTNVPGNAHWDGPIDEVKFPIQFVPLCRAFGWSDQTHISPTSYYRDFVFSLCKAKTFMEGTMQPTFQSMIRSMGYEAAHSLFGTYLCGGPKDGNYVWHSDGQGV